MTQRRTHLETTPATAPTMPQVSRREFLGSALLLIAVIALAGEAAVHAVYTPDGLARIVGYALAALVGLALGGARCQPPTWAVAVAALITVRALAIAPPVANVVSDSRLLTGVVVIGAVSAVPALLPVVRVAHGGQVAAGALAAAAAGYGLVVLGSRPIIDVFALLQGAARGLADGRNPYELTFPFAPPGQVDHCFTYLPGTTLLTAPGVWLGGDARWAELLVLLVAAAAVTWEARGHGGARLGLAVFVLVVPGTARVVQQSWTEPLLLVALVACAVLAGRGRFGWAAVAFGLALATKQHAVVLAPLLLMLGAQRPWRARTRDVAVAGGTAAVLTLPFLLANPARFTECTVDFFRTAAAPPTSLSLWLHVPQWTQLPLVVLGLVVGFARAWRYCPRTPSGFLLASAAVFTTFGLVNKQTFLNQWWLIAALVVAGLATAGARTVPRQSPDCAPAVTRR